ncbi:hypothetical protein JCM3774_006656 [Rhodotorula dairenensis]
MNDKKGSEDTPVPVTTMQQGSIQLADKEVASHDEDTCKASRKRNRKLSSPPSEGRAEREQAVSPAIKSVLPPYVGQNFKSSLAMEAYFTGWARAANFWLIGTQQTSSATYTCEGCRNMAKKQLNAAAKSQKCRVQLVGCSNGSWVVTTSELRHCCRRPSLADEAERQAPSSAPLRRSKKRSKGTASPDPVAENPTSARSGPSAETSRSLQEPDLDSQRPVSTAASVPPHASPQPNGSRPAANDLQAEPVQAESAVTGREIVRPSPVTTRLATPPPITTTSFVVTKPRISKASGRKARSLSDGAALQRDITAFLLSINGDQDVSACSRAATLLTAAGVKTAGDLAALGFLEDSARQLLVETLRLQGADDAALGALSYIIAKQSQGA